MSDCTADVQYLVGLFCSTLGQDGENLGSDAADVISVCWVAVSVVEAKVVLVHRSAVQPSDLTKVTAEILEERGITEDLTKCPSLQETLAWFDSYIVGQLGGGQAVLVTDGPNPLRQVLFPEASRKGFPLSDFYRTFFDVRRDFRRHFNNNENINSVTDILKIISQQSNTTEPYGLRQAQDLATVIIYLLEEKKTKGLQCFHETEVVKAQLEYGICTKGDVIDSNTVVRARGLPWQSSDHDVAKFFVGLNIAKGGVALCLSQQGRRNGEALVRFETVEQRDLALRRHRHFMGNRYIEVYRATGEDFIGVAAGNSNEAQQFLSKGAAVIIRMRGLPYDCTAQQIVEFFQTGDRSVEVLDGAEGILFVNKADGRSTGDAFVLVAKEDDAEAALARHKELIGTRYIELFRSTTAEVQQVVSKSLEPTKLDPSANGLQPGVLGAVPQQTNLASPLPGMLAQQVVIQGNRKDCIRLRGLPYEAQVQNILDFLGEYSKHIIYQGVHMVYNAQGHPSGEAFIQMDTEQSAAACANDRHNKYMQMGKKQRYIEVFQCSADDMSMVLTGPGAIPTTPVISPTRQLISPVSNGGLMPGQALFPGSNSFSQQQFLNPQLFNAAALGQNNSLALQTALAAAASQRYPFLPMSGLPGTIMYWPYPSPPVSPTGYFAAPQASPQGPGLVLMRGIPFNASVVDVMAFFQNFPELSPECVQFQRSAEGRLTGEALIVFPTRSDAERAVIEKNRHLLGMRPIELYIYNV